MNKFLRTYLPAFSMAFTFIILYATISNIIAGYSKDRFCFFILQVFVYLMVSVIVDWLLSFIDFSKYIYHFIAEMIILYPITILSLLGVSIALKNIPAIVIVAICSFVCYQIRINVEEAVLQKYFKEYNLYKEKTYKLFPYIY